MSVFRRYCRIHSFRFSLATHCEEVEPGLASLYPALSTTSGKCCVEWSIEGSWSKTIGARSYVSYEDGNIIRETQLIDDALDYLEWRITTRILEELTRFIQLHAAGLTMSGRTLLLVGPPGAGKSCLALCLLRQGWKCMSDEIILLDAASGTVCPFPRSLHVDFNTMEMFPEFIVKQRGAAYIDSKGKIRFDPSPALGDWVAEPSPPGWLVFPCYKPGYGGELEPLGETEAVSLMLSQAINLAEHGKGGLDALVGLVRRFQCFRLITGDLHTATSLLAGLTQKVRKRSRFAGQPSRQEVV